MNIGSSVQDVYYKNPVIGKYATATMNNVHHHVPATMDNVHHHRPAAIHALQQAETNNQNLVQTNLAYQMINTAESTAQHPAQAKQQTFHTVSEIKSIDQDMADTKPALHAVDNAEKAVNQNRAYSFIRSLEDMQYRQKPITLNSPLIPANRPEAIINNAYYSHLTPEKYMIRPIYVRLVKPEQNNVPIDQIELNRQTHIPNTLHATMQ